MTKITAEITPRIVDFYGISGYTPSKAADVIIKSDSGKVLFNQTITDELLIVANHPEVEKGGFTRYGNRIKDPLLKFYSGIGSYFLPGCKLEKEMNAKNTAPLNLRIFDSTPKNPIAYEMNARKQLESIKQFLIEAKNKYEVPVSQLKKIALDVVKAVKNAK